MYIGSFDESLYLFIPQYFGFDEEKSNNVFCEKILNLKNLKILNIKYAHVFKFANKLSHIERNSNTKSTYAMQMRKNIMFLKIIQCMHNGFYNRTRNKCFSNN